MAMRPITLCDDLDGEAQDRFWVEASCTVAEAIEICADEQAVRPTDPPESVWLRPKDSDAESWEPCEEGDSDGLEFYAFDLTTAEPTGTGKLCREFEGTPDA